MMYDASLTDRHSAIRQSNVGCTHGVLIDPTTMMRVRTTTALTMSHRPTRALSTFRGVANRSHETKR